MDERISVTVGNWQNSRQVRLFGSYIMLELVSSQCGVCPLCLQRVADTCHTLKNRGIDYDFVKMGENMWGVQVEYKDMNDVTGALEYLSKAIELPVTLIA
jgi:hypothetical protein